jgi:hypothetical protein
MDVSEVKTSRSSESLKSTRPNPPKPAASLSAEKVNVTRSEPVRIEVSERSSRLNKTREQGNDVIATLNKVAAATEEVGEILTGISGIAQQASEGSLPKSRREILDKEAQELLEAIDDRVKLTAKNGAKPLQGDPIEILVEEELGETLKVILPETSREELGLANLSVSRVDTILATRRAIDDAQNQLEFLRSKVTEAQDAIGEVLQQADIAAQNRAASQSSVRDVDAALELTGSIKGFINEDPTSALEASAIERNAVRLLTSDE